MSDAVSSPLPSEATVAQLRETIAQLKLQLRISSNWNSMSQRITTTLLEDTDEEEALSLIATSVREVAEADTALIVLPSLGGSYICEIADGEHNAQMIGLEFPPQGHAQSVIRTGVGMIVPSMERAVTLRVPQLSRFGPALYAPLSDHGNTTGVIILFRLPGRAEFTQTDLKAAEDLARQASLALRLSGIRLAEDRANLLEERNRIARDLHDLAIQQLFATSLQLNSLKDDLAAHRLLEGYVEAGIEQALASVSDSIGQIRHIVNDLRDHDSSGRSFLEGLWQECSTARHALGFAPSLLMQVNNQDITNEDIEATRALVNHSLNEVEIADALAVVREGLTNVARHAHANQVTVQACLWTSSEQVPTQCRQVLHASTPLATEDCGLLKITITDDGVGIRKTIGRYSGLSNMAARASVHFGQMQIAPREDSPNGTRLIWCIPVARSSATSMPL